MCGYMSSVSEKKLRVEMFKGQYNKNGNWTAN